METNEHIPYYPLFLDLRGRTCIVVGGGQVALRKVERFVASGAFVTVIAPEVHSSISALVEQGVVNCLLRAYQPGDLIGATLCAAATNDGDVNASVARDARQHGVFVNVVDAPMRGDYVAPAVWQDRELTIAISTSGQNPTAAKRIKEAFKQDIETGSRTVQDIILSRHSIKRRADSDPR